MIIRILPHHIRKILLGCSMSVSNTQQQLSGGVSGEILGVQNILQAVLVMIYCGTNTPFTAAGRGALAQGAAILLCKTAMCCWFLDAG